MTVTPEVLIVGAGPTGLMLALQLARRGIRLRIVDRNAGPARESRAVVVQARTLELFQQMGFGDEAVRAGRPIERLRLLHGGRVRAEVPIGRLGMGRTRYPFVLALGQDQTEAILGEQLARFGVFVERSTEVASIEDLGDTLRVQMRPSMEPRAATITTLDVPWLCGCDGAASIVRHTMGITFEGGTYEHRFYLADCHIEGPLANDEVTVVPASRGLVVFFGMAGDRHFRVLGRLPTALATDDRLSFDRMASLARETSGLPLTLSAPRWTSVYRLHHRCASALRAGRGGRVLILGDAAHVHSPVGGQGMNTGLQDATNLAWKLAIVLRGAAEPSLLSTFATERLPVARRLLRTTDRLFNLATNDRAPVRALRSFMLRFIAPRLVRARRFKSIVFRAISQTGIGYPEDHLAQCARRGGSSTTPIAPGERLPFVEIAGGGGATRELADLCRSPWFTAIILGGGGFASKSSEAGGRHREAAKDDDAATVVDAARVDFELALRSLPALVPFVATRTLADIPANRSAIEVFGLSTARSASLVIVRPDLHLFGVWPIEHASQALVALSTALAFSAS